MPIESQDATTARPAPDGNWQQEYLIDFLIACDDDGIYSAVALNLPGAGSCGDTAEEALENGQEAVRAVIESYVANGRAIPWREATTEALPADAVQQRVYVHA